MDAAARLVEGEVTEEEGMDVRYWASSLDFCLVEIFFVIDLQKDVFFML